MVDYCLILQQHNQIENLLSILMQGEDSPSFFNEETHAKKGNDAIFAMLARCMEAKKAGADVINATVGSLLDDAGNLAINSVVLNEMKNADGVEYAAYSPLGGKPDFLDLSISNALGHVRKNLENLGIYATATATPGGSGALRMSAANLVSRGDKVLLRDRHWGPYQGFLREAGLSSATWPLLGQDTEGSHPDFAMPEFEQTVSDLIQKQDRVLIWLNDPAHNPTGLSMTPSARFDLLDIVMAQAASNLEKGITLFIDSAYTLYAEETHGWAETLLEAIESGLPWPENLLICFGISYSKSHTMYGMRCGSVVSVHPNPEVLDRIDEIFVATGRSTWSAPTRLPQDAIVRIHSDENLSKEWENERDIFANLLKSRREKLLSSCSELGVSLIPSHDGFFAFLEHDDPSAIAEACASRHVYVVALSGGVRIGVCAANEGQMQRLAETLRYALDEVSN